MLRHQLCVCWAGYYVVRVCAGLGAYESSSDDSEEEDQDDLSDQQLQVNTMT